MNNIRLKKIIMFVWLYCLGNNIVCTNIPVYYTGISIYRNYYINRVQPAIASMLFVDVKKIKQQLYCYALYNPKIQVNMRIFDGNWIFFQKIKIKILSIDVESNTDRFLKFFSLFHFFFCDLQIHIPNHLQCNILRMYIITVCNFF